MTNELTTQKNGKAPIRAGKRGLQLQTLDDYWRFAGCILKANLAPKGMESQESIMIALQMGGARLGWHR